MKLRTTDSWKNFQPYRQPDISAIVRAIQREALEAAADMVEGCACESCVRDIRDLIPEEPKP